MALKEWVITRKLTLFHGLTLTRADADMLCSPKGTVASIQSKEQGNKPQRQGEKVPVPFRQKQVGACREKMTGNVNSNGFSVWQIHRAGQTVISTDGVTECFH